MEYQSTSKTHKNLRKAILNIKLKSGSCLRVCQGHVGWVWCLLSVGYQIWSGSGDKTIRIWATEDGANSIPSFPIHWPGVDNDQKDRALEGAQPDPESSLISRSSPKRTTPTKTNSNNFNTNLNKTEQSFVSTSPHSHKQLDFLNAQLKDTIKELEEKLVEAERRASQVRIFSFYINGNCRGKRRKIE